MQPTHLLLYFAIIPPLFILYLIFFFSKYEKHKELDVSLAVFFLGCLTVIPVFFLEMAFGYFEAIFLNPELTSNNLNFFRILFSVLFGVALIEEFCKFVVLKKYAFHQKEFKTAYDGIIYGVTASLGFALIENLLYIFVYYDGEESMMVAIGRMFSAIPAHGLMGVFMGYYIGKAKCDIENQHRLLLQGLLAAIALHTIYDYFLFLPTPQPLLSLLTLIIAFFLAIIAIKELSTHENRKEPVIKKISTIENIKSDSTIPTGGLNGDICRRCGSKLTPTILICYKCGLKI
jgi:protease PrsW